MIYALHLLSPLWTLIGSTSESQHRIMFTSSWKRNNGKWFAKILYLHQYLKDIAAQHPKTSARILTGDHHL
ncbi:hypothetical protein DFJ43DRAFT_703766 [Lentinula guzmanii]|uniref:PhoD-like phosphatase metallophosphatase domain-containing protein n=1 Tax=Lentinula guzmanii TaxID=2804957 RepID=A0AA38JV68_9AGAR|nr:hypothetical protein DFJ43DRAFT_703766 [Lentinula guzmanii]